MQALTELKVTEISALSTGVESIIRRLIRLMMGHISLAKLVEMVRLVYLEEVEVRLSSEFPDKSIPLSQVALLTGLDTRQVTSIRNHPAYRRDRANEAAFMRNMTPTTHLLDLWSTDLKYLSRKTGQPRPIRIHGPAISIEQLMKACRFQRGVTPKSIADRLLMSGAAKWNEATECLEMVTERFLPSADRDEEGAIEVGFNAIGRLIDTVVHNLTQQVDSPKRHFQRAYWTNRLAPERRAELCARLTQLMRAFEEKGTELLKDNEQLVDTPGQVTAGFGLYYFEGEPAQAVA